MEESDQCLMWMKRKQMLRSHIQAPIFGGSCNNNNNNNSWEEKAFAEDAARILGGCIWPPRSYSCNFCKREFRSAQALGGHMNVHRRDRARLKQSLGHHNNDFTTSRSLSSSWPSTISTQENCFKPTMSPSISWEHHMESTDDSEPKGQLNNAREQIFKGLGCNDHHYVETSLSVGKNSSVFGQKLPTDSCGDREANKITNKRPKTCISSLNPCSNDTRLSTLQSAEFVLGLKPGLMEDLDLELRLGKTQKV